MADSPPDKITPMLRQYLDLKSRYADALLLFQMGDFYETFFEDAERAAAALNITLTSRSRAEAERIPMAGFPIHASESYIGRLLEAGFKVVVCEQTEDPAQTRGLVRREVTRVLTRGTVVDPAALDARRDNYLGHSEFPRAITGDWPTFRSPPGSSVSPRGREPTPWGMSPRRLGAGADSSSPKAPTRPCHPQGLLASFDTPPTRRALSRHAFDPETARRELGRALGTLFLDGFGVEDQSLGVGAAGAVLRYLGDSHTPELPHLERLIPYRRDDYLGLDEATLRHLEIFETQRSRSRQGSLLDALDATVTPMGARLLEGAGSASPCRGQKTIESRLDGVEFFLSQSLLRPRLRQILKGLGDLERLTARVALEQATPREVAAINHALEKIPQLNHLFLGEPASSSSLVAEAAADLDPLPDLRELISRALVDDPPLSLKEGGIIREGYDPELDELIHLSREGKDWIARLEAQERAATGINSLKVRYNKVFGYYLEISKANLHLAPAHYLRKQTLVNAERFITADLKTTSPGSLGPKRPVVSEKRNFSRTCGNDWAWRSPALSRWPGPWQSWTCWPLSRNWRRCTATAAPG